jgi:hypothetical protein
VVAEDQAVRLPGIKAVDGDQRRAVVTRLGIPRDNDRIGDVREARRRVDDVRAIAGDVESNGVGARMGVGVQDGLAQRPGPGVVDMCLTTYALRGIRV